MIRMVRRMILALLIVFLTGCSAASSPRAVPSASAQPSNSPVWATVHDAVGGMTFERPNLWVPWQPNLHAPITDGPLLYLSTDSLLPACAVAMNATPNLPDAAGQACQWPLTTLSPGGVFIEWMNDRVLSPLPSTGELIEANGAAARVQSERPGSCAAIGADETMTVLVPTKASATMSNVSIHACLRGPDLETSEAQTRAVLTSIAESP